MDIDFILGALLAIPLGIAANILTPRYETWSAKRNQNAAARLAAKDRRFRARIERFRGDPEDYQAFFQQNLVYIMIGVVRMILISVGGIMAAVLLSGSM